MSPAPQVFPTKIDRWLAVVLATALAVQLAAGIALLAAPGVPYAVPTALGVVVLPIALVALLSYPTRYELHPEMLVIRSGVARYRIPYADLRSVEPTCNPLSAPAWSLDRLKLVRKKGYMLISPPDKPAFLHALAQYTPQLTLQGDRLIPTAR
jgi:membrane protein YdbS with pleckstrin-like domain